MQKKTEKMSYAKITQTGLMRKDGAQPMVRILITSIKQKKKFLIYDLSCYCLSLCF